MSKLKAYIKPIKKSAMGNTIVGLAYYLKSDVDKVIADLEESHKMEVEQLLMEIVKLKDAQRWREFSEKKPDDKQWILVYHPNHSNFTTGVEMRRWDEGCKFDVEYQELYTKWRPLPKAPEDF